MCPGSPQPSLLTYTMCVKISCAGWKIFCRIWVLIVLRKIICFLLFHTCDMLFKLLSEVCVICCHVFGLVSAVGFFLGQLFKNALNLCNGKYNSETII